jgi:glucose/arabinose dehydrogenase
MKKWLLLIVLLLAMVPVVIIGGGIVPISNVSVLWNTLTGSGIDTPQQQVVDARFQLAAGFSLNVYAGDLPNARFIAVSDNNHLVISRPRQGDVVLIHPSQNNAAIGGQRDVLLQGLTRPSGLAIHDGWLYIGEADRVGRIAFNSTTGTTNGDYQTIISGLTDNGNHPYKQIAIGPDGLLYLSQGSTCNVCLEDDQRRATMSRYQLDGSDETLIASGLRNTMGFDWAPWDNALYGTDNGRDMLGDDYPPCELNRIEAGQFYGWPYFNGANQADPDFPEAPPALASSARPPAFEFAAHNAPLGMAFIDATTLPDDFKKSAVVALHGSWNRSAPDGYKVVSLHWQQGEIISRDLISGFEKNGNVIGRPVDITQGNDGAIYISDDYAGAIYRLVYDGNANNINSATTDAASSRPTTAAPITLTTPAWLNDDNRELLYQRGKAIVQQRPCARCHQRASNNSHLDLATIGQRRQYQEIIDRLVQPTPPMPNYNFNAQDQKALAVYLVAQSLQR